MKIALASDHAGFALKEKIKSHLKARHIEVIDLGPDSEERVDYPDFAAKVTGEIKNGRADLGVLSCGTGIGMSIAANKITGIRAALVHDAFTAEMAKKHNNANVFVVGARVFDTPEKQDQALSLLDIWLNTSFEGGRHTSRLEKIEKLESNTCKPLF
jgi:ribose 5-phosphate isomerase B